MKYKVTTCKTVEGAQVIIKKLKNSYVGAPRYEVTVILTLRGAYTFIKSGYYAGEEDLAREAVRNIKEELGL